MKKLFLLLLCLPFFTNVEAQQPNVLPTQMNAKWYKMGNFLSVDSGLVLPTRSLSGWTPRFGTIVTNPLDSLPYRWDGSSWKFIGANGSFGIYSNGYGLNLTSNVFRADTTQIATVLRVNRLRDSLIVGMGDYTPTSRTISAGYGLSGGGNLSANRTILADTNLIASKLNRDKLRDSISAVLTSYTLQTRVVSTGYGLIGGGNLTTDRTLIVDSGAVVSKPLLEKKSDSILSVVIPASRTVSAGFGLSGGGDLSANRTFSADTLNIASVAKIEKKSDSLISILTPQSRSISTGFGLSGGGNLTANRTFSADSTQLATKNLLQKKVDSLLTLIQTADVEYGTYNPLKEDSTNTASITFQTLRYTRIGDIVTVSGQFTITPAASGDCTVRIENPVISAGFGDFELSGVAASTQGAVGVWYGLTGDDAAVFFFTAPNTNAQTFRFTYTYKKYPV